MQKKITLLASVVLMCGASLAQDVKKKIDEHAKDPKTKENAAKADVFIQNKRIVADTTAQYKAGSTTSKKVSPTTKKKKTSKKRCSPTVTK